MSCSNMFLKLCEVGGSASSACYDYTGLPLADQVKQGLVNNHSKKSGGQAHTASPGSMGPANSAAVHNTRPAYTTAVVNGMPPTPLASALCF